MQGQFATKLLLLLVLCSLGSIISRIDEEEFSVFAPNTKVLQETIEKINELTTQEVLVTGLDSSLNDNVQTNKGNARHWRANSIS